MPAGVARVALAAGLLAGVACGASDRVDVRAVAPSTTTTAVLRGDAIRYVPRPVPMTRASRSSGAGGRVTVPGRATARQPTTGPAATYRGNPAGSYNGYPCGGDLPYCSVLERESHGDPTAKNWSGCHRRGCFGLWQFDPRTWANYGGYSRADLAPAGVQNEKARLLWAGGRGCSHWGVC